MFHLITIVMGISLTAIVVTGGISYMHGDIGVRRETSERVTMAYRTFDAAVSAYRISNQGALPSPPLSNQNGFAANSAWRSQMSTYFPQSLREMNNQGSALGPFAAPAGMDWSYGILPNGRPYVCLSTIGENLVPEAVHEGLRISATKASDAVGSKSCGATVEDWTYDGQVALTFQLQSGN